MGYSSRCRSFLNSCLIRRIRIVGLLIQNDTIDVTALQKAMGLLNAVINNEDTTFVKIYVNRKAARHICQRPALHTHKQCETHPVPSYSVANEVGL